MVDMIDRLEKLGRLVLWVVISVVLVIGFAVVPLQLVEHSKAEAELRDELREASEELEELSNPTIERLSLNTMAPYLSGLDYRDSTGMVTFTNVSPREGVVCAEGVATHEETGESTTSLPSCARVEPYATVRMEMAFAGSDLARVCPKRSGCGLSVDEVPDVKLEK